MAAIYIPVGQTPEFRALFYKWRREQGDGFVIYPPEGPKQADEAQFTQVDDQFIGHLRAANFPFRLGA
jgi:hypothetical protein